MYYLVRHLASFYNLYMCSGKSFKQRPGVHSACMENDHKLDICVLSGLDSHYS